MGQAAFNSVDHQATNHPPGYYYLAIPVMVDGRDRVLELRIHKDERGNRSLDELEELRIAVSVDTANLGMVLFHVTWYKDNQLIIQGVVEKKGPKEVIERFWYSGAAVDGGWLQSTVSGDEGDGRTRKTEAGTADEGVGITNTGDRHHGISRPLIRFKGA